MTTVADHAPDTFEAVAGTLADASAHGRPVRIAGAHTKPWTAGPDPATDALTLRTTALDRILAHDPGDMTASLQAGVPLAAAQTAFAGSGQMLALDPPLGAGDAATIGGIVATGDCGPLAHRYGGPRDLVVGTTVALADGTVASSGGIVIKNVAGYDISKLLCGSFGTLGVILSVNVRLHPCHPAETVVGRARNPATLAAAALELARLPAELEALDVAWRDGEGRLLARVAGARAAQRAQRLREAMGAAGLADVRTEAEAEAQALWSAQRDGQRSDSEAVLHVTAAPGRLAGVLRAGQAVAAGIVARAALGQAYLTLAPERVGELRARLPEGAVSVLRDCPASRRADVPDPWGYTPPEALSLMRALKDRFDPTRTCNPQTFVGGI